MEEDHKYHWLVIFRQHTRPYPYQHRTVEEMAIIAKNHFDKHGTWPHRMWIIDLDDEIQKVIIT